MQRGLYFLGIILILLFFFLRCKNDKHKGELQFYYYPDKNAYYDPQKKDFWYSIDGAKNWSTVVNSNASEPTTLGQKVIVYGLNAEVYKDNAKHRKLYSGKLYQINTAATVATGPEVVERTAMTKKKLAGVKKTSGKRKNSIGKFIDKIFGKHR